MTRSLKSTQHSDSEGNATSSTNGHGASEIRPQSDMHMHTVPAGQGYAFEVKAGHHFRVVDLYGLQVVDFAAWVLPDLKEKLSMAYSRFHLRGTTPMVGECLMTNKDDPILRIVEDTVKVHDMTFMSCFPEMYEKLGQKGHRSCATNIAQVMKPYGMKSHLEVTDPFNIFQNTPNYTIKALNTSRPGDYIQFEALKDIICAVSCCPYDLDGFNGGTVTDVAIITNINPEHKTCM